MLRDVCLDVKCWSAFFTNRDHFKQLRRDAVSRQPPAHVRCLGSTFECVQTLGRSFTDDGCVQGVCRDEVVDDLVVQLFVGINCFQLNLHGFHVRFSEARCEVRQELHGQHVNEQRHIVLESLNLFGQVILLCNQLDVFLDHLLDFNHEGTIRRNQLTAELRDERFELILDSPNALGKKQVRRSRDGCELRTSCIINEFRRNTYATENTLAQIFIECFIERLVCSVGFAEVYLGIWQAWVTTRAELQTHGLDLVENVRRVERTSRGDVLCGTNYFRDHLVTGCLWIWIVFIDSHIDDASTNRVLHGTHHPNEQNLSTHGAKNTGIVQQALTSTVVVVLVREIRHHLTRNEQHLRVLF